MTTPIIKETFTSYPHGDPRARGTEIQSLPKDTDDIEYLHFKNEVITQEFEAINRDFEFKDLSGTQINERFNELSSTEKKDLCDRLINFNEKLQSLV